MRADDATPLEEVLRVLAALRDSDCQAWLEGGWGVDALVGRQTRLHRDVDVDFDATREEAVLAVLSTVGYVIDTDWRPNRVELVALRRGRVDLHPLVIEADGSARQAALGGGWHHFPRAYFTTGRLHGVTVPCVSAEAQRAFRTGYPLRDVDRHDLAQLTRLPPRPASSGF